MTDQRLLVALAATVVVLVVALLMWRLAERSLRRMTRLADRRQERIRQHRREITALTAELARYRTAHAALTPDAGALADDIAAIETYANTHREDGPR